MFVCVTPFKEEARRVRIAMDSIEEMSRLLRDVHELLQSAKKSERRAATVKLKRISDIASTLALILHVA